VTEAKLYAAVAGASGLVGGRVLSRLLEDPEVRRVIAPTRRPLPPHPKLVNPSLRAGTWPAFPPLDEAYCCLGTTRAKAGSDAAFRAVDLDLTRAFARAVKMAGARRFGLVSSVGADAASKHLYLRTKGQAEAEIAAAGFESVVIVRPSFLIGERVESRPAEKLATTLFEAFAPLLKGPLRKYRAAPADGVAAALIRTLRGRVPGALWLASDELAGD
jgi:uncharacterized protein YbjT (DUF2867 family)